MCVCECVSVCVSVYIHRAEGGEGPAREFPAFAQPHIDPTPANSLVLAAGIGGG